MLLQIMPLLYEKILIEKPSIENGDWQTKYLVNIHCLTEFIKETFAKMNIAADCLIPNMAKAKEMEELPKELETKEGMEPKEKTILIAQNLLFLAAKLSKWHNFREAIDTIHKSKDAMLNELIWQNMPPNSIGQFLYQKYKETKIEHKMAAKMSTKIEHHVGSSSTNVGENEGKKKGKATMDEFSATVKFW